jgi:hypothetical protein
MAGAYVAAGRKRRQQNAERIALHSAPAAEGYLYVLVERKSGKQWQGYAVTPGGMLAQFPVGNRPSVQFLSLATGDRPTASGASLVSIEDEEVSAIHMLFSPDVVPVAVLNQRARTLGMQSPLAQGVAGAGPYAAGERADQMVAEFKLNKDGAGTISGPRALDRSRTVCASALPARERSGVTKPDFDAHGQRLTNLVKKLAETKSPAIVLWDPIVHRTRTQPMAPCAG